MSNVMLTELAKTGQRERAAAAAAATAAVTAATVKHTMRMISKYH